MGAGGGVGAAGGELAATLAATCRPFDEARTLPGAAYISDEVFALEQRALFGRMWLCVGREKEVPEPGSYLTQEIGAERVLVVRDARRALGAFYNVCRHRGARLIEEPRGHLGSIISCPYHAWTYALDGTLVRTPHQAAGFRPEEFPLARVQLGCRHGLVFVNLHPGAPALGAQLADLPDLVRYGLEALECAHRVEYDVAANWKVVCENYSECYHCPIVHPQLHRISEVTRLFESGACFNGGPMAIRDGFSTMSMTGTSRSPAIAGLPDEDRRRINYYLVYPNLMLGLHPDYVVTHRAWPLAPGRTRVVCEWLFPQESVSTPGFDPADAVEFWDVTNRQDWALCERVQRGAASRGHAPGPYHPSERCVHTFDRWYAETLASYFEPSRP